MITTLIIMTIFQIPLASHHFVSFEHPCYLAYTCNHTQIAICGFNNGTSHRKMFVDDCQMLEFNCHNKAEYIKVDLVECHDCDAISTSLISTDTTFLTTTQITTTTSMPSTTAMLTTESLSASSSINMTTDATLTTEPLSTVITEKLPFHTCGCATATTMLTTDPTTTTKLIEPISETTLESTTTTLTTMTTDEPVTQPSQTCGCATATKSMTSNTTDAVTVIKNITDFTKSTHFVTCGCATATESTTTTPVTITTTTPMTMTTTTSEIGNTTTLDMNTTTVLSTITVTEPTTGKHNTSVTCNGIPKDCNVPSTWETTSEGETRDFFQILKSRYGRRAVLLADTTHWPTRLSFFLRKNTGNEFLFGNHNELG